MPLGAWGGSKKALRQQGPYCLSSLPHSSNCSTTKKSTTFKISSPLNRLSLPSTRTPYANSTKKRPTDHLLDRHLSGKFDPFHPLRSEQHGPVWGRSARGLAQVTGTPRTAGNWKNPKLVVHRGLQLHHRPAPQAPSLQILRVGVNNLTNQQYFTKRPVGYPGQGIWSSDGQSIVVSLGIKL